MPGRKQNGTSSRDIGTSLEHNGSGNFQPVPFVKHDGHGMKEKGGEKKQKGQEIEEKRVLLETKRVFLEIERSTFKTNVHVVQIQPFNRQTKRKLIMANTKIVHRSIASLKLPKPVPLLLTYAQGIVTGMTGNAYFGTPNPPLPVVSSAITDLGTAENAALKRTKGAVELRNAKRAALVTILEQLRTYVQTISDQNPENGAAIIASAGLAVRKSPTRAAPSFHVKQGAVSGEAKVVAPSAGHRSSYEWEYSTDGGKTWIAMPPTIQAKTLVDGLTPATTVMFRYRAVTKTGASDWSQPVALLMK